MLVSGRATSKLGVEGSSMSVHGLGFRVSRV